MHKPWCILYKSIVPFSRFLKINGLHYWNTLWQQHLLCQALIQYLELSSCFNNAMPRLTMLAKRLHCSCQPIRRTSSYCSTSHQTARISIRLTTRSGQDRVYHCLICDIDHLKERLIYERWLFDRRIRADGQWRQCLHNCIDEKADTLHIWFKHCHCKTENKLLLSSHRVVHLCDFVHSLISE